MLSDNQIKELLRKGKITIEPDDEKHIKAGKYNLHLGRFILVPKDMEQIIDPANPVVQPIYRKKDISKEGFILEPKKFVLGQTLEIIGLDADIGMLLDGSSTLARLGITILYL